MPNACVTGVGARVRTQPVGGKKAAKKASLHRKTSSIDLTGEIPHPKKKWYRITLERIVRIAQVLLPGGSTDQHAPHTPVRPCAGLSLLCSW